MLKRGAFPVFFFFQGKSGNRNFSRNGSSDVCSSVLPFSHRLLPATWPVADQAGPVRPLRRCGFGAPVAPPACRANTSHTTQSRKLETLPCSRRSHASADRDRKSTRLNSSHGYISYAVFCLKKK